MVLKMIKTKKEKIKFIGNVIWLGVTYFMMFTLIEIVIPTDWNYWLIGLISLGLFSGIYYFDFLKNPIITNLIVTLIYVSLDLILIDSLNLLITMKIVVIV